MPMPTHLLPTTVVGSYPQPEWLVDRAMLSKSVPRTRMHEMWRLPEEHLEEAQDDATVVAIRDMERAGIDIVTDGEIRRESYSNRFATALDGIDADNPAIITARSGQKTPVPRVVGKIRRSRPVELGDMEFLRRNTDHAAKITLPGPFTMSQQAQNDFYEDEEAMALDYAAAVNAEIHDLFAAGADLNAGPILSSSRKEKTNRFRSSFRKAETYPRSSLHISSTSNLVAGWKSVGSISESAANLIFFNVI